MNILLAIDGSPSSAAATDFLIASTLAAGAEVCVLHVVEWPDDGRPYLFFSAGSASIRAVLALRQKAMQAAAGLVDGIVARLRASGFTARGLIQTGEPRATIAEAATTWPADVIFMGSHGRRGLDRVTLGSVAESVMRRAACSVVIVRSSGELTHLRTLAASRSVGEGEQSPSAAPADAVGERPAASGGVSPSSAVSERVGHDGDRPEAEAAPRDAGSSGGDL